MKRNLGYAVLLAIVCAIFAVPAVSQSATVKGVCKDADGKPIADAQVIWHNTDNGRTFTLKTNKNGEPIKKAIGGLFTPLMASERCYARGFRRGRIQRPQ